MPTYRYQAVDLAGRTLKASLQAESERHARQLLREQGLFARQLQVQGNAQVLPRRQRVSRAQLCELTRQLATLTGAGIALVDALATLERQLVEPALRNLLVGVRGALAEGLGLARSLARQGGVFSALYCALVEAGERSGRLAQVLERLADHLEQVQRQQHKARTALIADAPGIITERQAEVGQVVQATAPIFKLARDGDRDAVFNVYESLLAERPADRSIVVSLLDNPAIKTTGTVREITPAVSPAPPLWCLLRP